MNRTAREWEWLKHTIEPALLSRHLPMDASPSIERIQAQAVKRQQIAFCVLTLIVIAALLLLHIHFAVLLGEPSLSVMTVLSVAFLTKVAECVWLVRHRDGLSENAARMSTAVSIVGIFVLAAVSVILTDRDDAPYFVLLSIAILQCAYRFALAYTCATIAAAIAMTFAWTQHFYRLHPPVRTSEFLEAGMTSVIYCLMGLLVWYLVNQLELSRTRIYEYMAELASTRQKLLLEEKLAAVGRLASGIAHEIRNPVGMIASSLSTATDPDLAQRDRDEMFAIATRESRRLEALTVNFLTYARPASPEPTSVPIVEILNHVASMTKIRAADRSIAVRYDPWDDVKVEIDLSQIESALLNLALNAVDATPNGGTITFRTHLDKNQIAIEVENTGRAISPEHLLRIFEPFFTTKPAGTGLGLAIARAVAQAHRGDLYVSKNENDSVVFRLVLPLALSYEQI